jgi:abortive infection bacteriophage resistance protein
MTEYKKQPLSIEEQMEKLTNRGLIIDDVEKAKNYLFNVSYYRLRAYTFPFQDNINESEDHRFIRDNIHFNEIIDLYYFDSKLRAFVFNAIATIEVAIRTKITYEYVLETKDSHWFLDANLYFDIDKYEEIKEKIQNEIARSYEEFIKHYRKKYDKPVLPPAWMTLEVLSFGTLSKLFAYLVHKSHPKKEITKDFGLPESFFLENWMHAMSILRNCCAHHSRVWNRRFPVRIQLPYDTLFPFIDRKTIKTVNNNKLFAFLSCMKYILDIISPDNDFKKNLVQIIGSGGNLLQLKDMGFPDNWESLDIWRN